MTDILCVNNLTKIFTAEAGEIRAVDNISFTVGREHRKTALIGPDGAGKSTLLRLIAGTEIPTAGECLHVKERGSNVSIGYMSQSLGLYEDLSVEENLLFFTRMREPEQRKSKAEQKEQKAYLEDLLNRTGLLKFKERKAGSLSGGMKQKLSLACTVSARPSLLLLDEPTVGVDPISRSELWQVIEEYLAENNAHCIFSSLYLEESERSSFIIFMKDGRIISTGSADELKDRVKNRCFTLQILNGFPVRQCAAALMCTAVRTGSSVIKDICPRLGNIDLLVHESYGREALLQDLKRLLLKAVNDNLMPGSFSSERDCILTERSAIPEDAYIDLTGSFISAGSSLPDFATDNREQDVKSFSEETVISVDRIRKQFGDFIAVHDSSFEVKRGEIFGLLGPNGAGKTTTFRMICALLNPSSGHILINGQNLLKAKSSVRATIGYVAQKFCLYRKLSLKQNLEYFGASYGLTGKKLKDRISALCRSFDLEKFADTPSGSLPFGIQRSLSMACALIHKPDILFLDEATSGADPLSRRTFWALITSLAAEGTTVIVTTHFMEEAEYCDRFLIQDQGKILVLGSPDEICVKDGKRISVEEAFTDLVMQGRKEAGS